MSRDPKIDPTLCIRMLHSGGWGNRRQCVNKRKVGEYCGVHDPAKKIAKRAAWEAKWDADMKLGTQQGVVKQLERTVLTAAIAWQEAEERNGIAGDHLADAVANLKGARFALDELEKSSSPRS